MILKLERANGVRDVLDRVGLAVRKVIARVDLPGSACARVWRVQNAIKDRIAEIDIARGHVNLGTQNPRAIGKLAGPHAAEQVEVFFDAAVPEWAVLAWLGQGAPIDAHLFRGLIVNISLVGPDQVLGPGVKLLEVVGRVIEVLAPIET